MLLEEANKIIDQEGYYEAFEHAGLQCRIIRPEGLREQAEGQKVVCIHWCGYVAVKSNNQYYKKDGDDLDIHGGITYTSHKLVLQPESGEENWWLGFDCAHAGDISMVFHDRNHFTDDTYKDKAYVIRETKRLAEQLAKAQ